MSLAYTIRAPFLGLTFAAVALLAAPRPAAACSCTPSGYPSDGSIDVARNTLVGIFDRSSDELTLRRDDTGDEVPLVDVPELDDWMADFARPAEPLEAGVSYSILASSDPVGSFTVGDDLLEGTPASIESPSVAMRLQLAEEGCFACGRDRDAIMIIDGANVPDELAFLAVTTRRIDSSSSDEPTRTVMVRDPYLLVAGAPFSANSVAGCAGVPSIELGVDYHVELIGYDAAGNPSPVAEVEMSGTACMANACLDGEYVADCTPLDEVPPPRSPDDGPDGDDGPDHDDGGCTTSGASTSTTGALLLAGLLVGRRRRREQLLAVGAIAAGVLLASPSRAEACSCSFRPGYPVSDAIDVPRNTIVGLLDAPGLAFELRSEVGDAVALIPLDDETLGGSFARSAALLDAGVTWLTK